MNHAAHIPLERLRIAHWSVDPVTLPAVETRAAFVLDTCMRRLVVAMDQCPASLARLPPAKEQHTGAAAYQLLLEVMTGLRSAVPGETNVLGQFRRAWEDYRSKADLHADSDTGGTPALEPVIAQALRDARDVRHRHLQNIGGASYGPLVRRLLKPAQGERVLFVGAGELARSMLPFFSAYELGIWNRSAPDAAFAHAGRVFAPADGAAAADWAHHVIMSTPANESNDTQWNEWLGASLVQSVIRLGHRRGDEPGGPAHALCYDLDDVFDLRRSQDTIRSLQLERARHECQALANRLSEAAPTRSRRSAAG